MKLKSLFAAALLVFAAPSMADTIKVFNLGNLSVPGGALLVNTFGQVGTYEDQYNFSIGQSAEAGGLTLAFDFSTALNIGLTGVKLSSNNSQIGSLDTSPQTFTFGALAAGSYTLSIFSTVTAAAWDLWCSTGGVVGYVGLLTLDKARTTSVPEPTTLALFGLALVGVAVVTRRRAAARG